MWWLLRNDSSPSVLILREGDAVQPAVSEKFRAWFKTDMGLQRIYPWLLFGPYVALVAWHFPLERSRLRRNALLNLSACALFVAGSHALDARSAVAGARVIFINSQRHVGASGTTGTNTTYIKVIKGEAPDPLEEQIGKSLTVPALIEGTVGTSTQSLDYLESFHGSNLVAHALPGLKPPAGWPAGPKFNVFSWILDLLAYSAIIGLTHSVHFYRRFREREHRALVLESSLVNAQLNALRAQLQPHFLFNSLNAIATLLRRDPRLAEETLMSLSELLRLALNQSERQQVALSEEMSLVHHYLEIQQTRFGDKLRVEQEIEPEALHCQVPTLLFQPLVENAIRHGLEPCESAGVVRLAAHRREQRLVLSVEDDGVGLSKEPAALFGAANSDPSPGNIQLEKRSPPLVNGSGIGLKNLRARLQALYGLDQKLELAERAGGGVKVTIEIPWCTEPRIERAIVLGKE